MMIRITTKIYSQLVLIAQPIPHQKRQNSSTTEFFADRHRDRQMNKCTTYSAEVMTSLHNRVTSNRRRVLSVHGRVCELPTTLQFFFYSRPVIHTRIGYHLLLNKYTFNGH